MRYDDFVQHIQDLEFIQDPETADAAVKAVLGILANSLDASEAQQLCSRLPPPLTCETLRGGYSQPLRLSVEEFRNEVSIQASLTRDQAQQLVDRVLHTAREAAGEEVWQQLQASLPGEWATTLAMK